MEDFLRFLPPLSTASKSIGRRVPGDTRIKERPRDKLLLPGGKVIEPCYFMAISQQTVDKSTPDEAGRAGYECSQFSPEELNSQSDAAPKLCQAMRREMRPPLRSRGREKAALNQAVVDLKGHMDSGMSVSPAAAEGGAVPEGVSSQLELPIPAILFFLALVILLFLPVLSDLVAQWFNDENMGYAFFVPLVAGYVIWLDRDRILAAPVEPCWPALALVVWGFLQMLLGLLGALSVLSRTAFVVTMVGVVWTIAGTAVVRALLFRLSCSSSWRQSRCTSTNG